MENKNLKEVIIDYLSYDPGKEAREKAEKVTAEIDEKIKAADWNDLKLDIEKIVKEVY